MELESSKRILNDLSNAAKEAGVWKKMFISFGTLLGAVRERGLIEHDTDLDVCFLPMPSKNKERFFQICKLNGLLKGWSNIPSRTARSCSGELHWFSAKSGPNETKCCNWFMFEWNDLMWHSKISHTRKNSRVTKNSRLFMKGASASYFRKLVPIKFLDLDMNAPEMTGSLLDFWYPDWMTPVFSGESCEDIVASFECFEEKSSWIME